LLMKKLHKLLQYPTREHQTLPVRRYYQTYLWVISIGFQHRTYATLLFNKSNPTRHWDTTKHSREIGFPGLMCRHCMKWPKGCKFFNTWSFCVERMVWRARRVPNWTRKLSSAHKQEIRRLGFPSKDQAEVWQTIHGAEKDTW
jgi:hypothetical protein